MSCQVCGENAAKYKCPRCLLKSCSLPCVKRHKVDAKCNGTRAKTAFVSVKNFNDLHLLNDYRFLEDVSRKCDSAAGYRRHSTPQYRGRPVMPNYLRKQVHAAKQRGVKLRLMPQQFAKSRNNSTRYFHKTKCMMWHIEWLFPLAQAKYSERTAETETLHTKLQHFIHPSESDPIIRQKLKMYTKHWPEEIKVFMKVEGRKANSPRYYELDISKTINENLKDKEIIVYPTFYVVPKDRCADYTILEEDLTESDTKPDVQLVKTLDSDCEIIEDKGATSTDVKPNVECPVIV